jgi:hypothetical protein
MEQVKELARMASVKLHHQGGLLLISSEDAPRFLDACERQEVLVLGVDGFRILDGVVEPDMNAIADFSTLVDAQESVTESRRFVAAIRTPGTLFEFTLAADR